jgi:hypothetical protein
MFYRVVSQCAQSPGAAAFSALDPFACSLIPAHLRYGYQVKPVPRVAFCGLSIRPSPSTRNERDR